MSRIQSLFFSLTYKTSTGPWIPNPDLAERYETGRLQNLIPETSRKFGSPFHQHYTRAFFVRMSFRQLFLRTKILFNIVMFWTPKTH